MTEDTALIEKREELKRQLAAGEYKTLVEVVLDGTGRLIQKLTRTPEPLPFWYSAVVIALATLLISSLTSVLLGEFYPLRREMILMEILGVGMVLTIVIASRIYLVAYSLLPGMITSWMPSNQWQIWRTSSAGWLPFLMKKGPYSPVWLSVFC